MKKISVLVPCFNECENVIPMAEAITKLFDNELSDYDYELVFIDNASTDGTGEKLEQLCADNKKVKAIFNVRNFGQFNSPFYGMLQCDGDCVISLCCDFQDPVEMIPEFVKEWETGKYQVVCGVKDKSRENHFIRFCRTFYYKLLKKMSDVDIIEHFTGFGLYDKSFIELLKSLDEPRPFLRGIVSELASNVKQITYEQPKRRAGKTHNNFYTLYDAAMLSFTSYTKVGLRLATMLGTFTGLASFIVGMIYLIMKLIYWDNFVAGMAPVLIGMFFLGAVILFFIGLLGEYILYISDHVKKRPLVVERKRINFDKGKDDGGQA